MPDDTAADRIDRRAEEFFQRGQRAAAGEFDEWPPRWLFAYANGLADAADMLRHDHAR